MSIIDNIKRKLSDFSHNRRSKPQRSVKALNIKAANTHGTKAGKWSARKAQLLAKKYKALGGGYY